MPVADVLIPAYNAEATIAAAVDSIRAQTVEDIRIVVVDDGSTDGTGAILDGLAAADPRVVLVRQANGGIVDALNAGLRVCTAAITARHDADDVAYPRRLERQIAHLRDHPDCVAVGANVDHIDARGRPLGTASNYGATVRGDAGAVPAVEPFMMHPTLAARRGAVTAVGGYRHVLHAEDVDLYWRLGEVGGLHNLPDRLCAYRVHDGSLTRGSMVNARIQALMAQLAAVDHRRRAARRPGLAFAKGWGAACAAAASLPAMVALDFGLTAAERDWLAIAAAAKLLENAFYRAYVLEEDDYAFVAEAMRRHLRRLPPADRRRVLELRARYAMKLVRERRWPVLAREGLVLPHGYAADWRTRLGAGLTLAEVALYQGLVRRAWRRLSARFDRAPAPP